ncbi:N-acyl homoserine lactonase family protein [Streptomyces sp. NPDC001700]
MPEQLFIVRYGTREATRSDHFLNYGLYGEPDAPMDIDYFFWVATGPDGAVVIDCGFSRQAGDARGRTTIVDPGDALRALGVEPESVGTVVITHAHYDHIGNLGLFPNADVVVATREVEFWRSTIAGHRLFGYYAEQSDLADLARIEKEGRLRPFEGRVEVQPGVVVTEVGGHTPGQSIVEATTAEGPVLIASDAVHFYEEIERAMPFTAVADLPDMYRAYDLIGDRVAATGARLVTGHDPATKDRFRSHPADLPTWVGVIGAQSV